MKDHMILIFKNIINFFLFKSKQKHAIKKYITSPYHGSE